MGLVRTLKDWALQAGAKHYVNEHIQRYGHMTNLQIDSATRTIHFEIVLKGENAPLTGTAKYQPKFDGDKKFLQFTKVETSREWMNILIEDLLKTRAIELPEGIPATVAKLLL